MQQLDEVIAKAQAEIEGVKDAAALEELRVQYLGKKGFFTEQMKTLGRLSAEERPAAGALINQAKEQVQNALNARRDAFQAAELNQKLAAETIDVTFRFDQAIGTITEEAEDVASERRSLQAALHSVVADIDSAVSEAERRGLSKQAGI